MFRQLPILISLLSFLCLSCAVAADVALTRDGQARCAIYVNAAVMADNMTLPRTASFDERQAEENRQRLRESVRDLALYLGKLSGAKIPVVEATPTPADQVLPILIGDLAQKRFGPPAETSFFKQGWRVAIADDGIGLIGENGESTSYAIYELLDRLGCRWYMPGEIGESIPHKPTITLPTSDVSALPSTPHRNIWYASDAFVRRNRLGGFKVQAVHALPGYISIEKLTAIPELNAERNGQRKIGSGFLCWGNPATAEAVAESIIAKLDRAYTPSISLSPKDGVAFCQCEKYCKPLDAGDFDPSMDTISITDRYIVFCNRIAEQVTAKYPDVLFGFLAYVQYTRPPVREVPHPNLVPEIAPITYCRAHAMTADDCPSRAMLKPIVEGWSKKAKRIAYYNYMYHLAETTVPYPMMHQMSEELPIIYGGAAEVFWQPETTTNFDSVFPGMWLTMRMAWDSSLDPQSVLDDLFPGFYGAAAEPMRRYWETFDRAWNDVPAHAGCGWSYDRRFTPEVMQAARQALNDALAAATTPLEYQRVSFFEDSLQQFERWMQMRWDLADGNLSMLHVQSKEWQGTQIGLGNKYAANYGYDKVNWSPITNMGAEYFQRFNLKTYEDIGQRLGRGGKYALVTRNPLREWHYNMIQKPQPEASDGIAEGEAKHWQSVDVDASEWPTTDIAVERWADLGLLGKYGTMWYRSSTKIPKKIPAGKQVYLWLAATDGSVKVFVNGQHIPYIKDDGTSTDLATSYSSPLMFDVTAALKPGEANQIAIAATRLYINELGTGGLLGPAYVIRDK